MRLLHIFQLEALINANLHRARQHHGEQIIRLDAASQTYITSTYQALSATWSNPLTSSPGQAFFFNLGPVAVPEPSTAALALLGLALCGVNRRHRAQ